MASHEQVAIFNRVFAAPVAGRQRRQSTAARTLLAPDPGHEFEIVLDRTFGTRQARSRGFNRPAEGVAGG